MLKSVNMIFSGKYQDKLGETFNMIIHYTYVLFSFFTDPPSTYVTWELQNVSGFRTCRSFFGLLKN